MRTTKEKEIGTTNHIEGIRSVNSVIVGILTRTSSSNIFEKIIISATFVMPMDTTSTMTLMTTSEYILERNIFSVKKKIVRMRSLPVSLEVIST